MNDLKINFGITARINEALQDNESMKAAIDEAINRFTALDFGMIEQEDVDANLQDLHDRDGRLLGRYNTPDGEIYINMDFDDNSSGTAIIMFCNEY